MERELEKDPIDDGDLTITSSEGEDQLDDTEGSSVDISATSTDDVDDSGSSNSSSILSLDQSTIMNQSWTNYQEQIHQLQLTNRKKDDEITRLKREDITKNQEIQENMLSTKNRYEMQIMRERKMFKQWQHRTQNEIKKLRGQMVVLKSQRPIYLKDLKRIKNELSGDLEISLDRYVELKQMDQTDLPLKNWIQLRTCDIIFPARQKVDRMALELRELRNNHDRLEIENDEMRQEMKKKDKDLSKWRLSHTEIEKELEEVSEQLTEKKHFYDQYRHKSSRIEEIESRSASLEKKCFELQNELDLKTKELTSISGEQAGYRKQNQIQRQSLELLKQDKMYLKNEVSLLEEQKKSLLETSHRQASQVEELKKKRDELFEQLLDHREGTKIENERRMQAEITRLQKEMKLDLEKMKNTHQEIFQKEHNDLKSRHGSLQRQNEQLRNEILDVRNRLQKSFDDGKSLQITSERVLNETKTKLKIQQYESEKLHLELTDLETENHNLKLDVEKSEKKIEILKNHLHKMEGEYHVELTNLQSEVKMKTTELEGYRKFEEDLDEGIEAIGESVLMSEENEGEEVEEERRRKFGTTEDVSRMMSTVPTSHKRRMQYCLTLVKKISLLEKQNSIQISKLRSKEESMKQLLLEKHGLEKRLQRTSQPYSYLVGKLEKSEGENKKQQKMLIGVSEQNRKLKKRVKKLLGVNRILGKDVGRLLEHSVQLQKMKRYFEGFEREENFLKKNQDNNNGEEEEDGELIVISNEEDSNGNQKPDHHKSR